MGLTRKSMVSNQQGSVLKHASSAHPQGLVGRRVEALASREHIVRVGARCISVVGRDGRVCAVGVDGVCRGEANTRNPQVL